MKKEDLISNIAAMLGVVNNETLAFDIFLQKVSETLELDESLRVPGLGIFQLNKRTPDIFEQGSDTRSLCLNFLSNDTNPETSGKDFISFPVARKIEDSGLNENAFSLSVDKPLIPIAGRRRLEFLVQSSYLSLQKEIEEKAAKLVAASARLTDYKLDSPESGSFDFPGSDDFPVLDDSFDFTKISSDLPWDFGKADDPENELPEDSAPQDDKPFQDEDDDSTLQDDDASAKGEDSLLNEEPFRNETPSQHNDFSRNEDIFRNEDPLQDEFSVQDEDQFQDEDPLQNEGSLLDEESLFEAGDDDLNADNLNTAALNVLADSFMFDDNSISSDNSLKITDKDELDETLDLLIGMETNDSAEDLHFDELIDENSPEEEEDKIDFRQLLNNEAIKLDRGQKTGDEDILRKEIGDLLDDDESPLPDDIQLDDFQFENELSWGNDIHPGNEIPSETEVPYLNDALVESEVPSEDEVPSDNEVASEDEVPSEDEIPSEIDTLSEDNTLNGSDNELADVTAEPGLVKDSESEKGKKKPVLLWLVLASILVVASAGAYYFMNKKNNNTLTTASGKEKYDSAYEVKPEIIERGNDDVPVTPVNTAAAETKDANTDANAEGSKPEADNKIKEGSSQSAQNTAAAAAGSGSSNSEKQQYRNPEEKYAGLFKADNMDKMLKPNIFSDGSRYTLQMSSWQKAYKAAAEVYRYRKLGYDSYIAKFKLKNDLPWYRVRVGNYGSMAEAEAALNRLP